MDADIQYLSDFTVLVAIDDVKIEDGSITLRKRVDCTDDFLLTYFIYSYRLDVYFYFIDGQMKMLSLVFTDLHQTFIDHDSFHPPFKTSFFLESTYPRKDFDKCFGNLSSASCTWFIYRIPIPMRTGA